MFLNVHLFCIPSAAEADATQELNSKHDSKIIRQQTSNRCGLFFCFFLIIQVYFSACAYFSPLSLPWHQKPAKAKRWWLPADLALSSQLSGLFMAKATAAPFFA